MRAIWWAAARTLLMAAVVAVDSGSGMARAEDVPTKEQLVEQLYSYDKEVSHNAIEVYIHRVRKKLADSGVEVRTHYGRGYVIDYVPA